MKCTRCEKEMTHIDRTLFVYEADHQTNNGTACDREHPSFHRLDPAKLTVCPSCGTRDAAFKPKWTMTDINGGFLCAECAAKDG